MSVDPHGVREIRGLMLAAALKPESLALLLDCTVEEAEAFRSRSWSRLEAIKIAVARARAL